MQIVIPQLAMALTRVLDSRKNHRNTFSKICLTGLNIFIEYTVIDIKKSILIVFPNQAHHLIRQIHLPLRLVVLNQICCKQTVKLV
jgi:hypothetical protein